MVDPVALKRALDAFGEAQFECGEWDDDDNPEEDYDAVYERAVAAEAEVWRVVGLTPPEGA